MVSRKHLAIFVVVAVAFLMTFASLAFANFLSSSNGSADCNGYSITIVASALSPGHNYTINYVFFCDSTNVGSGSIDFTSDTNTATVSQSGNWPGGPLTSSCNLTGVATLTENGTSINLTINGSNTAILTCGGTPPHGKTFSIGPSSMEGDLHISPGDWISGGYNFKFVDGHHGATSYSVTATVTVPVRCPDNSTQNIVIPLGKPGALNGGGVTTFTYNIAAGDTNRHATSDQNSILAWAGAVQAPATLCGGAVGRNQTGAVFTTTVTQTPQVGLVDWQFHYRDPNAKGKGNVNCTDASNPRRNDAATCGASWSQTVRDP